MSGVSISLLLCHRKKTKKYDKVNCISPQFILMASSLFAKMVAKNLLYYQSPEAVWSTGVKELLGRAGWF